jgi:hypothetical protein
MEEVIGDWRIIIMRKFTICMLHRILDVQIKEYKTEWACLQHETLRTAYKNSA